MPVYQYHCDACGQDFESTHRMSDPPLTECECGEKGQIHRLISAGAGLIFRGSGFYKTDYRGKDSGSKSKESESAPCCESKTTTPPAGGCGSDSCCKNKE
ncbi:zinc ribbon domain-containing protein [Candidatus Poribacteria bacterium]|nr:zinc ribbon domain-containing protein [Candidatus Poribacteria bacterium]